MQEYKKIKITVGNVMKEKRITAYRVVKETDLRYQTVLNYRDNLISKIDLDVLAKICSVLNCAISDVLQYEE